MKIQKNNNINNKWDKEGFLEFLKRKNNLPIRRTFPPFTAHICATVFHLSFHTLNLHSVF